MESLLHARFSWILIFMYRILAVGGKLKARLIYKISVIAVSTLHYHASHFSTLLWWEKDQYFNWLERARNHFVGLRRRSVHNSRYRIRRNHSHLLRLRIYILWYDQYDSTIYCFENNNLIAGKDLVVILWTSRQNGALAAAANFKKLSIKVYLFSTLVAPHLC